MLGPASSAQTALDLSTVDRMALRALRFARLLTLVGCFLVVPMTFGAVSASANVWTVEGGTHYLKTSGGELIKSWTAKEWQVWRNEPPRKSWRRFLLSGLSRSCLLVLDGGEFVAAAV
jgi:hypothetical protein